MIQRIQSVFLLVSLCFLIPLFFTPFALLNHDGCGILAFDLTGFSQLEVAETLCVSKQYSIMAYGLLICALHLVAIFMFKNRVFQLRLCVYNILFLLGLTGIVLFVMNTMTGISSVSYRLPATFTVISIILNYLAFRGIRKDEQMVQSLNRIR